MAGLSGVATDVAAGGKYTQQSWCAVVDFTKVECWGSNSYGQVVSEGSSRSRSTTTHLFDRPAPPPTIPCQMSHDRLTSPHHP